MLETNHPINNYTHTHCCLDGDGGVEVEKWGWGGGGKLRPRLSQRWPCKRASIHCGGGRADGSKGLDNSHQGCRSSQRTPELLSETALKCCNATVNNGRVFMDVSYFLGGGCGGERVCVWGEAKKALF